MMMMMTTTMLLQWCQWWRWWWWWQQRESALHLAQWHLCRQESVGSRSHRHTYADRYAYAGRAHNEWRMNEETFERSVWQCVFGYCFDHFCFRLKKKCIGIKERAAYFLYTTSYDQLQLLHGSKRNEVFSCNQISNHFYISKSII